jgi:4-hydroxyphenylpyruvate dioxygenase
MKIDRIHFYVEDAKAWRDWLVGKLGFQAVASSSSDRYTDTEAVKSGFVCFALSSPRSPFSPVWQFLRHHPPGVADVAFVVEDLENIIQRAISPTAQKSCNPCNRSKAASGAKSLLGVLSAIL